MRMLCVCVENPRYVVEVRCCILFILHGKWAGPLFIVSAVRRDRLPWQLPMLFWCFWRLPASRLLLFFYTNRLYCYIQSRQMQSVPSSAPFESHLRMLFERLNLCNERQYFLSVFAGRRLPFPVEFWQLMASGFVPDMHFKHKARLNRTFHRSPSAFTLRWYAKCEITRSVVNYFYTVYLSLFLS